MENVCGYVTPSAQMWTQGQLQYLICVAIAISNTVSLYMHTCTRVYVQLTLECGIVSKQITSTVHTDHACHRDSSKVPISPQLSPYPLTDARMSNVIITLSITGVQPPAQWSRSFTLRLYAARSVELTYFVSQFQFQLAGRDKNSYSDANSKLVEYVNRHWQANNWLIKLLFFN